jgi:alanyl-tRNA synthetase
MVESVKNSVRLLAADLYTTYGMPFKITRDIARERSLDVDGPGSKPRNTKINQGRYFMEMLGEGCGGISTSG